MKSLLFISILLNPLAVALGDGPSSDLCIQKQKQYGKNFISCDQVDWKVKPLSADFQPTNNGPMTNPRSDVKAYENNYPGILNTQYFSDTSFYKDQTKKGMPLASKFRSAMLGEASKDEKLTDYLKNEWFKGLQPVSTASPWTGKCAIWAAWSMNADIQVAFSKIRDGIICNGVPFTRGELKEIITALYPEPILTEKKFTKFYTGYGESNPDKLEDANVALSKLGMLGQGDMGSDFKGPADVLKLARDTRNDPAGKAMMMDRDPTTETWNQPVQKVTDVAYNDDSVKTWEVLTSAEFSPASTKPEQQVFLTGLIKAESDLTQNLLTSEGLEGYSNSRFCDLRKQLNQGCDDLKGKIPLAAQVDILNHLKETAYSNNVIQLKQEVSLVRHELIIEYGTENSFASDAPDKSIVQSYSYTAVHARGADGSDGAVIRSEWSPRTSSLSSICASPSLADARNSTAMTKGFDLAKKCPQGKVADPALKDREYFTGAVPPKAFKTFTAKPGFPDADTEKKKAYNKLLEFLSKCDHFDGAVDFLKHLDDATKMNSISAQEVDSLAKEYATVKNLLNPSYIQSLLNNNYKGIQGLGPLKTALKL
jgi:hypothetical protein